MQREHHLPIGDFPDPQRFKEILSAFDLTQFAKVTPAMVKQVGSEEGGGRGEEEGWEEEGRCTLADWPHRTAGLISFAAPLCFALHFVSLVRLDSFFCLPSFRCVVVACRSTMSSGSTSPTWSSSSTTPGRAGLVEVHARQHGCKAQASILRRRVVEKSCYQKSCYFPVGLKKPLWCAFSDAKHQPLVDQ